MHASALWDCSGIRCGEVPSRHWQHVSNPSQDHEYLVIKEQIENEAAQARLQGKAPFLDIFRGPNLRRTIGGVVGACSQPLAGAPVRMYFYRPARDSPH